MGEPARVESMVFLTSTERYGHTILGMASMTIKSTYSLDVGTVRALERIAERWKVSKSEALRRAIRSSAGEAAQGTPDALEALNELQRSLKLTPARARAWARRVRTERKKASLRRETLGR